MQERLLPYFGQGQHDEVSEAARELSDGSTLLYMAYITRDDVARALPNGEPAGMEAASPHLTRMRAD